MPLVALLRLVLRWVTDARAVLGGTGGGNQSGIDCALFEQQAFGSQRGIDDGQD